MIEVPQTQPPKLQVAYSETSEMTVLLAKILTLVAPTSMTTDQQELWLRAAIEALQDIRAAEVRSVILELQRTATRPNQIVPEIARLVAEKRGRSRRMAEPKSPYFIEREIAEKANGMRGEAMKHKDDHKRRRLLSDAFEWERQARIDAGLHVEDYPKPLDRQELDTMPAHIRQMGLNAGFLEYRDGKLVESAV